jgi:hypothetical protein
VTDRKWIYITLTAFLLLGAAFFFFLGSVVSLVGKGKGPRAEHRGRRGAGRYFDANPSSSNCVT